MPLRLFILQPTIVFQAQINLANAVYPLSALPYDNITVAGSYANVKAGMTLVIGPSAGDDEKGRQRVRKIPTADTIFVGRSSQGTKDGELDVIDNHWITVYDDYRVWARLPYIDPAQIFMPDAEDPLWTTYKDGDIEVGTNTTLPPPVANCGPGWAGTKPLASAALVEFNAVNSFAVAPGATITTYFWDIKDGTFTFGTSADAFIVASFPPGFRWVSLTVVDSNAKGHIAYAPVYVRDPVETGLTLNDFKGFQITERTLRRSGQTISFKLLTDLPRSTYLDGTLFMLWEDGPGVPSARSHMEFIGWHHSDAVETISLREGVTKDTTLTCLDVAGKLGTLPGLPQIINTDAVRVDLYELENITWEFMPDPHWNKWLHYLIHWHSTALNLADWQWVPNGETYPFIVREAQASTLYEMFDTQCQNLVPDHYLTCTSVGQMFVLPDPRIVPLANRTEDVQVTIGPDKWSNIRYNYNRFKQLYWLWSSAVGTQEIPEYLPISIGDKPRLSFPTYFCVAPGHAPGQGANQQTIGNKLARTQAEFNICEGNRYGMINARHDKLRITLATGNDHSIEPAVMSWVTLQIPAEYAAQRGIRFTEARGLVHEVSYKYTYGRDGVAVDVEFEWEREVFPNAAVTVTPGVATPPPIPDDPPVIPDDPLFYDPIKGYILWDGAHVMRTWNLLGSPPTWELVDTGITGSIYDGQYVMVDATTVGMWLMTSTAIWWCADIMATTPSWSNVLPIATVQAADAVPATGSVEFQTMAHYASAPGFLCVATGLRGTSSSDAASYAHGYFWHTHNYGAAWTQVDTDYLTHTNSGLTRGYCRANLYNMSIYTTSPGTIYCLRTAPQVGTQAPQRILISRDLGDTWEYSGFNKSGTNNQYAGTLGPAPYPDVTDAFYATQGPTGTSVRPYLWLSTDEFSTSTQMTENGNPPDYGGFDHVFRVNKRTHDPNHVMGWNRYYTGVVGVYHMHLLESYDRGATWSLLWDSGVPQGNLSGIPQLNTVATARYNTPNGWPVDPTNWALIRCMPLSGTTRVVANAIQITLDNFATLQDKTGNIEALVGTDNWTTGPCSGFFLPKVGPNV